MEAYEFLAICSNYNSIQYLEKGLEYVSLITDQSRKEYFYQECSKLYTQHGFIQESINLINKIESNRKKSEAYLNCAKTKNIRPELVSQLLKEALNNAKQIGCAFDKYFIYNILTNAFIEIKEDPISLEILDELLGVTNIIEDTDDFPQLLFECLENIAKKIHKKDNIDKIKTFLDKHKQSINEYVESLRNNVDTGEYEVSDAEIGESLIQEIAKIYAAIGDVDGLSQLNQEMESLDDDVYINLIEWHLKEENIEKARETSKKIVFDYKKEDANKLLENWHQKNNDIDGAIASANYLGSKDLSNTLINSSDYYNELENLSAAIDSLKQAINAASKN